MSVEVFKINTSRESVSTTKTTHMGRALERYLLRWNRTGVALSLSGAKSSWCRAMRLTSCEGRSDLDSLAPLPFLADGLSRSRFSVEMRCTRERASVKLHTTLVTCPVEVQQPLGRSILH